LAGLPFPGSGGIPSGQGKLLLARSDSIIPISRSVQFMARLIGFILIFVVFLTFIILNLGNGCDISFGFKTIPQVPVFITAFSSFVLGMLFAVPFVLTLGRKKQPAPPKPPKPQKGDPKKPGGPDAGIMAGGVPLDKGL
jgi:uncharacterized integral membrane protein